ncbi:MAG: flagellar basal-body rod protein FlgF [Candidatus Binatia bacterium]|nr:flagellar basal-body rod protein FlgF [Candidatus Binatia bacterium]
MNAAMYKAVSGAIVQMRRLEVVAQNLANVSTAGYKGERLAFGEILASVFGPRERTGGMVVVGEQRTDFSQGELQQTGNPFDLAIVGDGFFVVDTPRGIRYTRQGTFTLAADGTVVTPLGDPVLGEAGPIRVEGETVQVTPEGVVLADGIEVDTIRVVRFADPRRLTREGYSLFRGPDSEAQTAPAQILQGHLEQANVNPIETMVTLITLQRQFEAYERALRSMDAATEKMLTEAVRV